MYVCILQMSKLNKYSPMYRGQILSLLIIIFLLFYRLLAYQG